MKTTIDGFEIEGTPSEIKEFLSLNKPSTTFKTGNSDMDALKEAWTGFSQRLEGQRERKPRVVSKQRAKRFINRWKSYTFLEDSIIKAEYRLPRKHGFVKRLSKRLGRTPGAISERARFLKIRPPKPTKTKSI